MTLPQVYQLYEYWRRSPPEHEVIAMLARVYTTWEPDQKPMTAAEHMASLEERWRSGQAMSPAQLLGATGGRLSMAPDGSPAAPQPAAPFFPRRPLAPGERLPDKPPPDMGGIGPFPGAH